MTRRSLMIVTLCLCLTACGTDAVPVQQPTAQITEITTPAVSVCTVTITEINGSTLIVTPAEGSSERSSSDRFTISAEDLDDGVQPQIGMTLEITYDGTIMETGPALFGGIQKVTVVSEPPAAPLTDQGTLMNDLVYEIAKGDSYDSQYNQRGYYMDVADGRYQYTICSGAHSTGGYGIRITGIDTSDSGTVIVTVEESSPAPDKMVTEAFTYPNCSVTFSYEPPNGIIIRNSSGKEFEHLDNAVYY